MTVRQRNAQRVWDALPGTSKEMASKAGLSVSTVQRCLRAWQDEGLVDFKTRHFGSLAHTFIYYPVAGKKLRGGD